MFTGVHCGFSRPATPGPHRRRSGLARSRRLIYRRVAIPIHELNTPKSRNGFISRIPRSPFSKETNRRYSSAGVTSLTDGYIACPPSAAVSKPSANPTPVRRLLSSRYPAATRPAQRDTPELPHECSPALPLPFRLLTSNPERRERARRNERRESSASHQLGKRFKVARGASSDVALSLLYRCQS